MSWVIRDAGCLGLHPLASGIWRQTGCSVDGARRGERDRGTPASRTKNAPANAGAPKGMAVSGRSRHHQRTLSIQPLSALLGAAPTLVAAASPFLKRIIVGMPRTP